MTKIVAATAFIAVFFCISPANAQMLSVQNSTTTTENKQQDWSFYTDAANRMLYIDFEKINVNLAAVSVKTLDGDRKSTRLNSSHLRLSRMPSSA